MAGHSENQELVDDFSIKLADLVASSQLSPLCIIECLFAARMTVYRRYFAKKSTVSLPFDWSRR